jgi:intracellular sulfur oxidation DsrE/DsrF family protein
MNKSINWMFLTFALFGLIPIQAVSQENPEEKVVYHFNDSSVARAGLNNIRNHLEATGGKSKIVVVTHGPGIDFLLEGAQDKNGNPYNINVEELSDKGVEFRVCNNTLKARNIDPSQVLMNARIVPSGVAEIGRLQAREGYAYLKP